jgi:ADP-dependent phosphofructokinase/glucokinase
MFVICAYNINLDAVHNLTGDDLSLLMEKVEKASHRPFSVEKLPKSISRPDDLLNGLLYCIANGSGTEMPVDSLQTAQYIESSFDWEYRLGGNAGNMANVLAKLGVQAILNAPGLGEKLAMKLHSGVRIPMPNGTLSTPSLAQKNASEPVHFVFQFSRGNLLTSRQGTIAAPKENRLIASFDRLNRRMCTNPHFDEYCDKHLEEIDGALVSGFHLVSPDSCREVLDRRLNQIRSWKEKKPQIYIHAEMGSFQKPQIMKYVLERLPADSIGMNEDELAMIQSFPSTWNGILEAAKVLLENLGVLRVCIHTRDFIISVLAKSLIHPEEELKAIEYGAEVAAGLALTGDVTAMPSIQGISISPAGVAAVDEFCRLPGARRLRRSAYVRSGTQIQCLIPSLSVMSPAITVGLGDAMTAAAYFLELQSI